MTRKELNLAIFEGTADNVLWQPRLEMWHGYHKRAGTLPDRYKQMDSLLDVYDNLGCSVRYAASVGIEQYNEPEDVEIVTEQPDENTRVQIKRTGDGELRTVSHLSYADPAWTNERIAEFPVKTVEDLRVFTGLIERERFRVDVAKHKAAAARMGHRGEPTHFLTSSGLTNLVKHGAGLENTFYLLADHGSEVEAYLEACDRSDDRAVDAALELPCRIFNLGDHATNEFTPPPILEKYLLARWQKISRRLGEAGRFVHSHWDGHSRLMLPYLAATGLHGVEALTPEPMGDMSLELIRRHVPENMVVLDLIPAILFLPSYSVQDVVDFAKRAIDMFAPRLILGVSDEISPTGQIEKIAAVSEYMAKTCGLAE